jgi:hypothetical protein
MMFVSRAGLMLLILWGVAVALCLDAVLAGRRRWLGPALVAIVLVEQGVTTRSYDKSAERAAVSSLASRVGGDASAFFYSPHDAPRRWPTAHLDAMWAGLAIGKPTVNGYSGSTPPDWRELEDCTVNGPPDESRLREALEEWRRGPGRSAGRVEWLDGATDRVVGSPPQGLDPRPEAHASR